MRASIGGEASCMRRRHRRVARLDVRNLNAVPDPPPLPRPDTNRPSASHDHLTVSGPRTALTLVPRRVPGRHHPPPTSHQQLNAGAQLCAKFEQSTARRWWWCAQSTAGQWPVSIVGSQSTTPDWHAIAMQPKEAVESECRA
eukprot:SAG31_NODE_97_length_25714_cov_19.477142_10_plen_142_part_00